MAEWANDGIFTAGFGGTKDPLIGAQADSTGSFSIPSPEGPMVLPGLPRFVTTRGGAYCFLPSITAIHHLADSLPEIVDSSATEHQRSLRPVKYRPPVPS